MGYLPYDDEAWGLKARIFQSLLALHKKVDQIMGLDQDLLTAARAIEAELVTEEDSLNELINLVGGLNIGSVITAADIAAANAAIASLTADRANLVTAIGKLPTPITLTPGSLTLSVAAGTPLPFTASETANPSATFTAVSSDPTIAMVAGSSPTFQVTPVAVGVCTVTVTDENSATAPEAVTVGA